MGLLKIAICDDSEVELKIIKNYMINLLDSYDDEYVLNLFNHSNELLKSDLFFDLLLLDVEMGEVSGINIKEMIEKAGVNSKIIFISNYQDKVIDAFGKNVYAYINKKDLSSLDYVLSKFLKDWQENEVITLNKEETLIRNIIYLEGDGAYTNIVLKDKK